MTLAKKKHRICKKYKIILIIVGILIILRLILPSVILHYANIELTKIPGYYGHIDDIDLSLYRGAYQVNDMYLNKADTVTKEQTELFKSPNIDLSVEWKALFHGSIVGEVVVNSPKVIFTKDKAEFGQVIKDSADFRIALKKAMPLQINRFEINNGSIHYADQTSNPKVDVSLEHLRVLALNLKNVEDNKNELPTTITASANAYEGMMSLNMKLNALADNATFDMNAEIKNTNLVKLNDFLKAYGNFDVNKGNFGLYTEMAAKDGKFKGYVKPIIKDLDVVGPEDRHDSFFHKIWESVVGAAGVILKNQKKDQVATKVEMEGNFNNPQTNTLDAIWQVLRNAFIQALIPSIDNQININSVKIKSPEDDRNLLQRIFSKNKTGKDKKEKGKKTK
ncbi:MAG: DUF748 domain-containing protein [Bacteroidota bacterium]